MPNPLGAERPLYEVKANLFKALAHPVRVRILEIVSATDEVSVSALINDVDIEPSHLSQHLAVLRRHNLVISERRGSQVFYRATTSHVTELLQVSRALLVEALEHTLAQLHTATV
ncbi:MULTISPECIES: ArsR/SmtB family transcription factor [unclassified Microbacterium]|uniref:ArsR/SmtB family transcription factor n=1 Tax=unclassified Microbacterium TaxID=2609290 RepID=UPI003D16BDF6